MKTTFLALSLVLVPALARPAAAQDSSASDLVPGDRVELTFLSGATLGGTLVAPPPGKAGPGDAPAEVLTLDVSWEYPGLNGTLTVPKKDVKSVRRLRAFDARQRELLLKMKAELAEEARKTPVRPAPALERAPAPAAPPEPPAAPKTPKELEDLKKAQEFYGRYSPPYWGPDRHTMNVQKRARGQVLTAAEQDFEAGYPALWEQGRAASLPKPEPPKEN